MKSICLRFGNITFLNEQIELIEKDILKKDFSFKDSLKIEIGNSLSVINYFLLYNFKNFQNIAQIFCNFVTKTYFKNIFFDEIYQDFNKSLFNTTEEEDFQRICIN